MVEAVAAGDAMSKPCQFREKENGMRKTKNRVANNGNGLRWRRIENWGREVVEERPGTEYGNGEAENGKGN